MLGYNLIAGHGMVHYESDLTTAKQSRCIGIRRPRGHEYAS